MSKTLEWGWVFLWRVGEHCQSTTTRKSPPFFPFLFSDCLSLCHHGLREVKIWRNASDWKSGWTQNPARERKVRIIMIFLQRGHLVDRPTQLICISDICWVGGGDPCGAADFCISGPHGQEKQAEFDFFSKYPNYVHRDGQNAPYRA